jgi:hypothetical protein
MIKDIFPKNHVELDYRIKGLMYQRTNRQMTLDVYIPELKLAFEYQGGQHYDFHHMYGSPLEQQQR